MSNKNLRWAGITFFLALALTVVGAIRFTNSQYFCTPDNILVVYDYTGIGLSFLGATVFTAISVAKKDWEIDSVLKAICVGFVAAGLAIFVLAIPWILPYGTPFFYPICYFL